MGPEALPQLKGLLKLTDDQLSEYVALWKEKNQDARDEATSQLGSTIDDMKAEAATKLAELDPVFTERFNSWVQAALSAGLDIPQGLIDGLTAKEPDLKAILGTYGADIISMLKAALAVATTIAQGAVVTTPTPTPAPAPSIAPPPYYVGSGVLATPVPFPTALYPEGQGPGHQYGGMITEPTLLWSLRNSQFYGSAGEAGEEAIVPMTGLGGMGRASVFAPVDGAPSVTNIEQHYHINVEVQGSVRSDLDLVDAIRTGLLQIKDKNLNLGLA
jgi:hypothetical protein